MCGYFESIYRNGNIRAESLAALREHNHFSCQFGASRARDFCDRHPKQQQQQQPTALTHTHVHDVCAMMTYRHHTSTNTFTLVRACDCDRESIKAAQLCIKHCGDTPRMAYVMYMYGISVRRHPCRPYKTECVRRIRDERRQNQSHNRHIIITEPNYCSVCMRVRVCVCVCFVECSHARPIDRVKCFT